jgi:hypothetical protein
MSNLVEKTTAFRIGCRASEGGRTPMPRIFTPCDVTGKLIDTGIEIERTSFITIPTFVGKIACPHCGGEHAWSKDTAKIVDEKAAP